MEKTGYLKNLVSRVNWEKQFDDWANLNTLMSVVTYGVVYYGCTRFLAIGFEAANIGAELRPVFVSLPTFLPGLIIVITFAAYRGFYRGASEGRRQSHRIVTWRRYSLPLMILMSITTLFLAVFLFEDLVYSSRPGINGGFAFGSFAFPLYYYGSDPIVIPSLIFWAGYVGYLMTLIGVTLRRIITNNLVPHFYLASSFGLIKSIVAAVLTFMAVDALPGFIQTDAGGIAPGLAILVAFTAGATADDIITWLIGLVRGRLGRKVTDPLPLSLVQGIDPTLEAYLNEEGIGSIQALATTPPHIIADKVGVAIETAEDWQSQANFLRSFSSAVIAERFHRLGINELRDLTGLAEDELAKALAAVNEKEDLTNEDVNKTLIKVLKAEAEENVRRSTAEIR